MSHSNQLREFLLTDHGVDLLDVYVGPEGVLTGSSRLSQEAREKSRMLERSRRAERKERDRTRKREALEARILALRKEFEVEEEEAKRWSRGSVAGRDDHGQSRSHGPQPSGRCSPRVHRNGEEGQRSQNEKISKQLARNL